MSLLAGLLASLFALLAVLHLYWAFGGRWAAGAAVPKRPDGRRLFVPGTGGCLAVAGGLLTFAYFCLLHAALVPNLPPSVRWPTRGLVFGAAAVFTLRAVGDFRYFGLFRRVGGTDFAALDRKLYTPLCAGLAAALLRLAW